MKHVASLLIYCCLGCVTHSGDAPTIVVQERSQPEDLIAKAIDVVHARSLDGLTALTGKGTVVQYGYSAGEGGTWSSFDRRTRPCTPAEFIKNIRWDFKRESAKVTIERMDDESVVAIARWPGRGEPDLVVTLQVVCRRSSGGRWEIHSISLREDCTRKK